MPLRVWAAQLADIDPRRAPADSLGLHLADAIAALWAGRATKEGQALARIHGPAGGVSLTASAIRLTEIDDIHLETCITPSAVVVPAVLAVAAASRSTPADVTRGLVAGYATLLRHGRLIGGAAVLAKGIWPSLVAAPLGAAAAAAATLGLPADRIAVALRLALLRSTGRIGQPPGPLPARWFVFGEAVADGMMAARAAAEGLVADPAMDRQLLPEGAADLFAQPLDHVGIDGISLKPFCTSRQAAGGVVVFRDLMERHRLDAARIVSIDVAVPSAYIGMLSRPLDPSSRLSTLTSQGFQIAAAALSPGLLFDIERAGPFPPELLAFARRVRVEATADFDDVYPGRWPARVTITTAEGQILTGAGHVIPGDPGAKPTLDGIREKSPSTPDAVLADAAASPGNAASLRRLVDGLSFGVGR